MPISLSFENFPLCPKCSKNAKISLIPVYEFSGGTPETATIPREILYWKCSNPECEVTITP